MHGCETMVRGRAAECELRHPEPGGGGGEGCIYRGGAARGCAALDTEGGKGDEGPSLELDGNIITSERSLRET